MRNRVLRVGGLAALLAGLASMAGAAAPLRNEDIVRMVLAERPAEAIVAAIESSPADFDLSAEMIDELRRAGVPSAVIEAMSARVAALEPTVEPDPVSPGRARLTVRFDSAGNWIAPATASDLAVFLACTTPGHAPSPWRPATPLGEDFAVPRHEMLAFTAGAGRVVGGDAVPSALVADVVPGERHDLLLGLAVRTGTRWAQIASVSLTGVIVPEGGTALDAAVEAPEREGATPRLSLKPASTPTSKPPPPPS